MNTTLFYSPKMAGLDQYKIPKLPRHSTSMVSVRAGTPCQNEQEEHSIQPMIVRVTSATTQEPDWPPVSAATTDSQPLTSDGVRRTG